MVHFLQQCLLPAARHSLSLWLLPLITELHHLRSSPHALLHVLHHCSNPLHPLHRRSLDFSVPYPMQQPAPRLLLTCHRLPHHYHAQLCALHFLLLYSIACCSMVCEVLAAGEEH